MRRIEQLTEMPVREVLSALQTFVGFEQRNLWKTGMFRTGSESGLVDRYLPECRATFELPHFRLRRKDLYIYGTFDGSIALPVCAEAEDPRCEVLFPVHPVEAQQCAGVLSQLGAEYDSEDRLRIWATPTSSTRTVFAWTDGKPEQAYFAKLSLCSTLLGDRRLSRGTVARSVGLSQLVQKYIVDMPPGIRWFPEPLGLTPRVLPGNGALYRFIPREIRDGSVIPAPLFAIMGGSLEHRPLFIEWNENRHKGALELVEDVLLARFAKLWVDLVFDCGIILEAHAQDLLLALSPERVPLGDFYYRDFEGVTVDWMLRRARGIPEPYLPHACEWFSTYDTWGYPRYQLVSQKIFISLFDYVNFVLAELEGAIREWQSSGWMARERIAEGQLTFLFSRYLRRAIMDKFGLREAEEYDVRISLTRFVKFLMQVRREVMRSAESGDVV